MINDIAEAVTESHSKESHPLCDVRNYAVTRGALHACGGKISSQIQKFGPASQVDMDWNCAPSYPPPYITELKDIFAIPGCRILLNAKGEALSDEIDLGFRLLKLRPKLWDMEITEGPRCPLAEVAVRT